MIAGRDNPEARYTLEEARWILQRELCLIEGGHELEQNVVGNRGSDKAVDIKIFCRRCRTQFVAAS